MDIANGYIGLTDPDWYSFLCAQARVDEVNFWQPHGGRTFRRLRPGELFFFKLRAPRKAIAGFGFFDRLREEFKNGRSYYSLHGSAIDVPKHEAWRPSRELLDWHGREVFKG
ncbi:MAG: hypothetical protein ACRERC_11440 [Candidatus Binatia bacterium]